MGPAETLFSNYIPVLLATIVGFILVLSALLGARLLRRSARTPT